MKIAWIPIYEFNSTCRRKGRDNNIRSEVASIGLLSQNNSDFIQVKIGGRGLEVLEDYNDQIKIPYSVQVGRRLFRKLK